MAKTANCAGCGAPGDPGTLVCRYCGRVSQDLASAADELRALDELTRAGQEMSRTSLGRGLFGALGANMMNNLGQGPQARIAAFWQNAFIPRSLEAQCQAALQMIGLIIVPDGPMQALQNVLNSSARKAESIYFDRADAILSAMRIHHAGDPEAAPKIAAVTAEVDRERQRVRTARRWGWLVYGALVGGSLGFLGLMAGGVALLG